MFTFNDYDKISDTLMYFSDNYTLKFNVILSRYDKGYNSRKSFHYEYRYMSEKKGEQYGITRTYNYYLSIECKDKGSENSFVILKPGDVYMLQMLIKTNIIPWFMGPTRIFGVNKNGVLCITTRKFNPVEFPLNEYSYMKFYPSIISYEDGTQKEGVRVILNDEAFFFDATIDQFLHFAYIIDNLDMTTAAMTMLNYTKIKPYQTNYKDFIDGNNNLS